MKEIKGKISNGYEQKFPDTIKLQNQFKKKQSAQQQQTRSQTYFLKKQNKSKSISRIQQNVQKIQPQTQETAQKQDQELFFISPLPQSRASMRRTADNFTHIDPKDYQDTNTNTNNNDIIHIRNNDININNMPHSITKKHHKALQKNGQFSKSMNELLFIQANPEISNLQTAENLHLNTDSGEDIIK